MVVWSISASAAAAARAGSIPASLVVCCLGADLPAAWLRGLGVVLRELRGEPLRRLRAGRGTCDSRGHGN